MKQIRVAILDLNNGVQDDDIQYIQEMLARMPQVGEVEVFDIRVKRDIPGMDFDAYISSGGPGDPNSGDGLWDVAFYQWIDRLYEWNAVPENARKQVLFICHSFQMACIHFKVAQVRPRRSPSYGVYPVYLTEAGLGDPVLAGLENPVFVADFRHWQVVQPDMERMEELGASILAFEKVRPHVMLERAVMAIRFSPEMIGVQFHPETSPESMSEIVQDARRRELIIAEQGQEKYDKILRSLEFAPRMQAAYEAVIPQFIQLAAGG